MGYAYLVSEILGCLVAAAALGGGIVWWWMNQKQTDWNNQLLTVGQKFETASLELAAAKKGLSEESKRTAELTSSLSAVAAKHKELEAVAAGKEFTIMQDGKAVAKTVPLNEKKPRMPGRFAHLRGDLPSGLFDQPLSDDELAAWEGKYSGAGDQ